MSPAPAPGIGVDGCNGGWAVAVCRRDPLPVLEAVRVVPRIDGVAALADEVGAGRVLVDIPIGLSVRGNRGLDDLARLRLGRTGPVFQVPPRAAFDALDYAEVDRLARAAGAGGVSVQAWNIMPKIREVDLHLRRRLPAPPRLIESHPELAFAALAAAAGREARLPSKRSAAGRRARLELLAGLGLDAADALDDPPRTAAGRVGRDDLLDAVVLALVAVLPEAAVERLDDPDGPDPLGLPRMLLLPDAAHPALRPTS